MCQFLCLTWDDNSTHFKGFVRKRGHYLWVTWKHVLPWVISYDLDLTFIFEFPLGLNQHFPENSLLACWMSGFVLSFPSSVQNPCPWQTPSKPCFWGHSSVPSLHCLPYLFLLSLICLLPTVTVCRQNAPHNLALNYMLSYSHICVMHYNHLRKYIVNSLRRSYCKLLKLSQSLAQLWMQGKPQEKCWGFFYTFSMDWACTKGDTLLK